MLKNIYCGSVHCATFEREQRRKEGEKEREEKINVKRARNGNAKLLQSSDCLLLNLRE
jgi:hypothetical protein